MVEAETSRLSLEKEFEVAAGEILRWISFAGVVKLARLQDAQLWIAFSFYRSMEFCMILRDSSSLVSPSFCDFGVELYTQDLVKFLRRRLLQDIFKIASEDVRSFTVLWSGSKDYVCLFTATELSSCIASFETTGNLETCTLLPGYEFVVWFSFVYVLLDSVLYGT